MAHSHTRCAAQRCRAHTQRPRPHPRPSALRPALYRGVCLVAKPTDGLCLPLVRVRRHVGEGATRCATRRATATTTVTSIRGLDTLNDATATGQDHQ